MATNRIAQHLAALTPPVPLPEIPEPQPPIGTSCYQVIIFDPHDEYDAGEGCWRPIDVESAPRDLKFNGGDDCETACRFEDIRHALAWCRAFNAPRLADWPRVNTWAAVVFVDGPTESVGLIGGKCVTPIRYHLCRCYTAKDWQPRSLWSIPSGLWLDEGAPSVMQQFTTAAAAVREARQQNRKFRRNDTPAWQVVLAVEAEPFHELGVFEWNGRRNPGRLSIATHSRLHVVDRHWPGLESVKGGGA